MGSRDIGKMVTEKVSFEEWLIFKDTYNFASYHAAGIILISL